MCVRGVLRLCALGRAFASVCWHLWGDRVAKRRTRLDPDSAKYIKAKWDKWISLTNSNVFTVPPCSWFVDMTKRGRKTGRLGPFVTDECARSYVRRVVVAFKVLADPTATAEDKARAYELTGTSTDDVD